MRSVIRHRVRDGLAVASLGALLAGYYWTVWAFLPAFVLGAAAAVIDPETASERARRHRRQQRAADMRRHSSQRADEVPVRIHGHRNDCGCLYVPEQVALCPADAALGDIEAMADGHD